MKTIDLQEVTPEIIRSLYEHRLPIIRYDICWEVAPLPWQVSGFIGLICLEAWGEVIASTELDVYRMYDEQLEWHYRRGVWRAE